MTELGEELPRTLNLGCGNKRMVGALNVDVSERVAPDQCFDLDEFPWPLPDNHFEKIVAMDVLEHLRDLVGAMEEIWRVSAPNALIDIAVPHYSCVNAFADPTHTRCFSYDSFAYFSADHELGYYSDARFAIVKRTIFFQPGMVNKLAAHFARRWPHRYEKRWAWMFPAWFLSVQLEARK